MAKANGTSSAPSGTEDPRSTVGNVGGLTRRDLGRLAGTGAVAAALAPTLSGQAAVARPATQDQDGGGRVVFGVTTEADTLDPHATLQVSSSTVFANIFDPLVGVDAELRYEGIVAESWEVAADGLSITFILRPDLVFHDGTPLDAAAVKFTFDRLLDPVIAAPAASQLSVLQSTEVVDPRTVRLTLSEPFSPLLQSLGTAYAGILSPTAVEEAGADFGRNPVGSGPFKLGEWRTGEELVLVPFEGYQNPRSYVENKGAPRLDELVYRLIPQPETQLAAFETGEIHHIEVPPQELEDFQANPDYQVIVNDRLPAITYLEFAMLPPEGEFGAVFKPPFDDLRVRQAIAHAINVDAIIEGVLNGLATRNYGPLPVATFAYNPDIEQFGYAYDQDRARALLEEAGWVDADGDGVREKGEERLDLVFLSINTPTFTLATQVIQSQLAEVGIATTIETLETATFLAQLTEATQDLNLLQFSWPEPDILYLMTDTDFPIGRYRDETFRGLVTEARRVSDLDERSRLYFEASQKLLADAAMVPLWSPQTVVALRSEVGGVTLNPYGAVVPSDLTIEE